MRAGGRAADGAAVFPVLTGAGSASDQSKLIVRAAGFLNVARAAVERFGGGRGTHAPVLHCIAQALEVSMKGELVAGGMRIGEARRLFGHRIVELWKYKHLSVYRGIALGSAVTAWESARSSGDWKGDDFGADPRALLNEYVVVLGRLHNEGGFPLRYLAADDATGPVPFFLLDVFEEVVQRQLSALPGSVQR